MENMFNTILTTSLYASIVGLFILAFKQLMKNRVSPRWHFIIWMVLIIKLVVPFGPKSPFSLFNRMPNEFYAIDANHVASAIDLVVPHQQQPVVDPIQNADSKKITATAFAKENSNVNNTLNTQVNTPITQNKNIDFKYTLTIIWLTGTIFILFWFAYSNLVIILRLRKCSSSSNIRIDQIFQLCKAKMNVSKDIPIVLQSLIKSPCMYGILKPKILLTDDILKLDDKDITYVLMHELAHYKRKDIAVNYVLLLLQAVHWFNPVIWYCFKRMRHDMEVATDQRVLDVLESSEHKEYGKALLLVLENFSTSAITPKLVCMVDDKKNTEKRIRMIKLASIFKSRKKLMMATGILCITFLGGILLTSGVTGGNSSSTNNTVDKKLEALLKYKTPYVGNNSKVAAIINNLDLAQYRGIIALKTKNKPYGIEVNYKINLENGPNTAQWRELYIKDHLKHNAGMLFSLIDNVDVIVFNVTGDLNQKFEFTRDEIQKSFIKDIRNYSKDIDSLTLLSNSINYRFCISPKKYSPLMSSTPGIQISKSDMANSYTKYTTQNGNLITWNRRTGKITNNMQSARIENMQSIYWVPPAAEKSGQKKYQVNAVIYDETDKPIVEKRIEFQSVDGINFTPSKGLDLIVRSTSAPDPIEAQTIDEAVHLALNFENGHPDGEFTTEGHVILDTDESNGIVNVYTMTSMGCFEFNNGIFTMRSGSGATPTLLTFAKGKDGYFTYRYHKYPMDGTYYAPSIKEMFPRKLWSKALDNQKYAAELQSQLEAHAAAYLKSIGRKAKISNVYVSLESLNINDAALTKLFKNPSLSSFPAWIGTREFIENGIRYIYKTSKEKGSDGYDLIKFEKAMEDGIIVKRYAYKIIGSEPKLISTSNSSDKLLPTIETPSLVPVLGESSEELNITEAKKLIRNSPLYEITFDDFYKNFGIQVYKHKDNGGNIHSYMTRANKVVPFGSYSGSLDTKNICIADLDNNGKPELLYYTAFGSGINHTIFQTLSDGKMLNANFSSAKFIGFSFIKKDLQNVELAIWYPDIEGSEKDPLPIGKLYINNNKLCLKLYDNLQPNLMDSVIIN